MGKREGEQEDLFVTHQQLRSQSHPLYRAVNRVLADQGFDRYVQGLCSKFYAKKMGRPGLAGQRPTGSLPRLDSKALLVRMLQLPQPHEHEIRMDTGCLRA